tara:strand:+ start:437 stop:568 length:132 start_codon:yes stop_codon:yes gene_type:complete
MDLDRRMRECPINPIKEMPALGGGYKLASVSEETRVALLYRSN